MLCRSPLKSPTIMCFLGWRSMLSRSSLEAGGAADVGDEELPSLQEDLDGDLFKVTVC